MIYADIGPKLVERGYSVIPIKPGTKQPGHMFKGEPSLMPGWTKFAGRLPTSFEVDHWSSTAPDFGAGLVMFGNQIGVDIDVDDPAIVKAIRDACGPTPAIKSGQKGETRFYIGPGVESRSYNEYLPDPSSPTGYKRGRRLCDIIGPGRQTVLPPSIHPETGNPYRWTGHAALDALDPVDLPIITPETLDAIGEALRPFGYLPDFEVAPRSQSVMSESDNPFRALNDAALADLQAWVPKLGLSKLRPKNGGYVAVAHWRPSSTGRPIEKRGANLKIHPQGIVDFHDGERRYTPINLMIAATGCTEGQAFEQLSSWLGRVPDAIDLQPRVVEVRDGHLVDTTTGEVLNTGELAAKFSIGSNVQVGGLVGEIANWIVSIARRPQPKLALAAALSIIGTVASRQMVTPTYSNLNLYLLMVTRSGNGKDAPIKAVKSILSAAKVPELIGPEGVSSDVALYDIAARYPVSVLPIDEFGDFIAATTGLRAAPHTLKIMAVMRMLWDGGLIKTPHAVSRNSEVLYNPCLSMICASTPAQFFDAVGGAQVLNGFLNRFLLVNAPDDAPRGRDDANINDVPISISSAIEELANRPGGFDMARFRIGPCNTIINERPYVIPWIDEGVRKAWIAYEDQNLLRMKNDHVMESFAPRCAQNVIKIASILAIGDCPSDPAICTANLEAAIFFVEESLADMTRGYHAHTPDSPVAALADKIQERLKRAGGYMTHRDLWRSMRRAFRDKQDLRKLMDGLVEACIVERTKECRSDATGKVDVEGFRLL